MIQIFFFSFWVNLLWSSNGYKLSITTNKWEAMSAGRLADVKIAICDVLQSRLVQEGPVNLAPWQFQLLGWGWLYPTCHPHFTLYATHHHHAPIHVRLLAAQCPIKQQPKMVNLLLQFHAFFLNYGKHIVQFYPVKYKLTYCIPFHYMDNFIYKLNSAPCAMNAQA